jgi:hypothetical protein
MYHQLVIGGRKQNDSYLNGSSELTEVLREAVTKAGYSPMQVRVEFYPWWTNFDDLSRRLHLLRLRYRLDTHQIGIGVSAFSRGVGRGLIRLAGAQPWYKAFVGRGGLERYGLTIDNVTWCDGIYHDWWALWKSVVGAYRIVVPANGVIDKISVLRQETYRPMGAPPVVSPPTRIVPIQVNSHSYAEWILKYPHIEMDDAPEYHATSLNNMMEAIRRFVPIARKDTSPNVGMAPSPLVNLESKLENTSMPAPEPIRQSEAD